jgi:hypothetical protein
MGRGEKEFALSYTAFGTGTSGRDRGEGRGTRGLRHATVHAAAGAGTTRRVALVGAKWAKRIPTALWRGELASVKLIGTSVGIVVAHLFAGIAEGIAT